MKLIGWLFCKLAGRHKRGKRLETYAEGTLYKCPRCGATWTRKVKGKK